jgi:hypothetical protein
MNVDISPLFLGGNYKRKGMTISNGENVARGQLLGVVTATGKLKASVSTATDGSQIPKYIAIENIDASASDINTDVLASGKVAKSKLVFANNETIDTIASISISADVDGTETVINVISQSYYDFLRQVGILVLDDEVFGE